ncbi:SUMO-conjugating enzyme SCE1-like [Panicum miliaceum]|uniref:SUMO-conjugating enzyme SCE1-like n=1 Tax=Panicum miliaceum TaxID=4540 RepID=A0A3L6Q727_PANMI|nr:SUMO-conjugating enzyme SCE1-like [Panicum miliaceum]
MASGVVARGRLTEERRRGARATPMCGLVAKPGTRPDGSVNLMVWKCVVPGKEGAWKPSISMRQILIGIQDLLDNPNPASPAQDLAYDLFTQNMPEYRKRVRQQAQRYPSLV